MQEFHHGMADRRGDRLDRFRETGLAQDLHALDESVSPEPAHASGIGVALGEDAIAPLHVDAWDPPDLVDGLRHGQPDAHALRAAAHGALPALRAQEHRYSLLLDLVPENLGRRL